MPVCAREIRTVVRQRCPVYLFSQTDSQLDDLPLLPGEPGFVPASPRQSSWLQRLDPLFCKCGYEFSLDGVLNSLPAFGPVGGVAGETGVFANSVRAMWAARSTGPALMSTERLIFTHVRSMTRRELGLLKQDIARNGIKETIKYVEVNGQRFIVDGHHRVMAARQLGVKEVPVEAVQLPYGAYKSVVDLVSGW